jgi:Holliday junction resolvase
MTLLTIDKLKLYNLLFNLEEKFGDKEVGRIIQILLALNLITLNFKVSNFQLTGEPDFNAINEKQKLCTEVKTTRQEHIDITKQILKSISVPGFIPTLAVLFISPTETEWKIIDARKIKSGRLNRFSFNKYSMHDIETLVNKYFFYTVQKYYERTENGTEALYPELKRLL